MFIQSARLWTAFFLCFRWDGWTLLQQLLNYNWHFTVSIKKERTLLSWLNILEKFVKAKTLANSRTLRNRAGLWRSSGTKKYFSHTVFGKRVTVKWWIPLYGLKKSPATTPFTTKIWWGQPFALSILILLCSTLCSTLISALISGLSSLTAVAHLLEITNAFESLLSFLLLRQIAIRQMRISTNIWPPT